MTTSHATPGPQLAAWLKQTIGVGDPITLEALPGATSSDVYAVSVEGTRRFVLRLFTNAQWLADEPDLAEHEAAALRRAERAGLAAPRPIARGAAAQCGVPAILMTHLPGSVDLHELSRPAALHALAQMLAKINAVEAHDFPWRYRSWRSADDSATLQWLDDAPLRAKLRAVADADPPAYAPAFVHRDFHPVNVLWQGPTISGVVDWVNACRGPAGVDVAHCRLNLALMYGLAQANEFLSAYIEASPGYEHAAYWDVDAALSSNLHVRGGYAPWQIFGLPHIAAGELRLRLAAFLDDAVVR